MAIQFICPSCQQPIEVDDEWAGESVACPYCKKAVSAPETSTWPPPGDIPQASPAGSPFESPPPPPGTMHPHQYQPSTRPTSAIATWALMLAITCVVLSLVAWFSWLVIIFQQVEDKVGIDAGQEETNRALMELFASGAAQPGPFTIAAAVIGAISGLGGLLLAIRALLIPQVRKGKAITACILSACFICCQMPIALNKLTPTIPPATQPATTQPATTQPATTQPANT